MSLFEILTILIVGLLFLKPKDMVIIGRKIRELNLFIRDTKKEILSHIDLDVKEEEASEDIEQVNFYLEKIATLGSEYSGDYNLKSIKSHYNKLISKKIKEEKSKDSN